MDPFACAKFVECVGNAVGINVISKRPPDERRTSLIATMQKILILTAETMQVDRNAIYGTKEAKAVMVVKARYGTIIF